MKNILTIIEKVLLLLGIFVFFVLLGVFYFKYCLIGLY